MTTGARALLTRGDTLTWDCGQDGEDIFGADRDWRHEFFTKISDRYHPRISQQYRRLYAHQGRARANLHLTHIRECFGRYKYHGPIDEDYIKASARKLAHQSLLLAADLPIESLKSAVCRLMAENGIQPPECHTDQGLISRAKCEHWWARRLRKQNTIAWESISRQLNMINIQDQVYVSDETISNHRTRKAEIISTLESILAVNEDDEEISLAKIADKSISNPEVMRNELMVRIDGCERYANQNGYIPLFVTITCPGRMHSAHYNGGEQNARFDGTDVTGAHEHLKSQWAKSRARLARKSAQYFGVRIAEPHHDGTPHWHLLIFCRPEDANEVTDTLTHYALEVDGTEPGAAERRITFEHIDKSKGRATSYVAKYISKNIDGHGLADPDQAASKAERVRIWASAWNIRQFQFFGTPPVSVWRELRRLREPAEVSDLFECCRQAADEGDWAAYIEGQGGIGFRASDRPIQIEKLWDDSWNRYQEPKGYTVVGLRHQQTPIPTRFHTWTLKIKGHRPPPNEQTQVYYLEGLTYENPDLRRPDPRASGWQ